MAVVNGQVRNSLEGAKVRLLPLGLRGIVRAVCDDGREVAYPGYPVFRQEQASKPPDV